ncbi:uncharacterized protein LOC9642695 [Selaginella moellendorffii]|uniref:uncharacterized protein LOC9642695 n=1 Tax=Selaginella moellendorffii TaxID=88036 RepID=UPI000D1CE156|nr:uncharacterized protein LOC9642695 [Selaginella moellendorffii]|eukprot:XP_002961246.2 uncharacterized protein LOC9642695 [Selaginella moellendorffii]
MPRSGFWKDQLLKAAEKMCRNRMKSNRARVVLNGEKIIMGRAKRGIFAGRHIQFGNKVSEKGGNKTRRTWKPNVRLKRLYSFSLDRFIRVHVTTHALRCIDKAGGLDEYLLNKPDHKLENDLCLYWKRELQTMNRFLFKLQCGNVPPELHKEVLHAYVSRMASRRGLAQTKPILIQEAEAAAAAASADAAIDEEPSEREEEDGKGKKKKRFVTPRLNMAGGGNTLFYGKCKSKRGVPGKSGTKRRLRQTNKWA